MHNQCVKLPRPERPEVTLLLNCARVNASPSHKERIRTLLRGAIEWEYLLELARRNCVLPLVYVNLQSAEPNGIPPTILASLARSYQRTAFDNLFLTQQLIFLLAQLEAGQVPAIAYKGPVLTQGVYGNLALRQFGDLDIIVRQEDLHKAKAILLQQRFVQKWPESNLSSHHEEAHIQQKYNYTFYRAADHMVVELHWAIVPRYLRVPWQAEWLWQRLDRVMLAEQAVSAFPPEELLLTLCLHGANHCWNRLQWVCDIAELVQRYPELDWDHVLDVACKWRAERMLHLGLTLAHSLLDSPLPKVVKQRLVADTRAIALASQSCKWLFADRWLVFRPLEEPFYHLQMRDHWRDRLYYCTQMLAPTGADRAFLTLPQSLSFLYYPLRPVQLITKHGFRLLRKS